MHEVSFRDDHGAVLLEGDAICDESELEGATEDDDEGAKDIVCASRAI